MTKLTGGYDTYDYHYYIDSNRPYYIDSNNSKTVEQFQPPRRIAIDLTRHISSEEVGRQELKLMPGFKVSWYYSGMDVEPIDAFNEDDDRITFIRNTSNHEYFML